MKFILERAKKLFKIITFLSGYINFQMELFYLKQLNRNSIVNIKVYETILDGEIDSYSYLIKFLNFKFPQILFILGIITNSIQFISYLYKSNRSLNKVYFLTISVTQFIALFCTLANYTSINKYQSLSAYSNFSCKIFNFIYRTMTNLTSWIAPLLILTTYFTIITKDKLNTNESKTRVIIVVCCLLMIAASLDVILIEKVSIIYLNNKNSSENFVFHLCAINDKRNLIIRDIIDFLFYFLLPFNFLIVTFCLILREIKKYKINGMIVLKRSKNYKLMLQRFKAIPFYFLLFNFPIVFLTLVNNFFNLNSNSFQNSFSFEFLFTIIIFINQSHYFLITFINLFYDKFILNNFIKTFGIKYDIFKRHESLLTH